MARALRSAIVRSGLARVSWRSTIESAIHSGDKLLVTTQIRDANSSVWLALHKVKSVDSGGIEVEVDK